MQYSIGGTAFLAAGNEAKSQVIYEDIDPDVCAEYQDPMGVDIGGDGVVDFFLGSSSWQSGCGYNCTAFGGSVYGLGEGGAEFMRRWNGQSLEFGPINLNTWITPDEIYGAFVTLSSYEYINGDGFESSDYYNPWGSGIEYIGFRFLIDGQYHYGWIAIEYGSCFLAYAYNNTPNSAISAGGFLSDIGSEPIELADRMKITPNPASDLFYLDLASDLQNSRVLVMNGEGKIVKEYTTATGPYYDISDLENGIYWVQIRTMEDQASRILIKQH